MQVTPKDHEKLLHKLDDRLFEKAHTLWTANATRHPISPVPIIPVPEGEESDREDWSVPTARRRNLVATGAPEDLGWLVANQYQISIGWEAPADVTDADTELSKFTVYWNEGNAGNTDVTTWAEATKHGSPGDAGDGELAQADFALNSYVDAG